MGSGEEKNKRFKFEIRNEGVPWLKNLPNFYWIYIKSPRTQFNKNHSKSFFNLIAAKRTIRLFLKFPRILWLGSKVTKS